ncbi:MAG: hypothetical protein QM778_32805 [Myxococcales bacterium]
MTRRASPQPAFLCSRAQGRSFLCSRAQGRSFLCSRAQGRSFLCSRAQGRSFLCSRAQGRASTLAAALVASSVLGGCRYDLDKLFEGQVLDGGPDLPVPDQLIEFWKDKPFSLYSDACAACATAQCGAANAACKADPECVEFTRCIAASTDPGTQSACRAQFAPWLSEDVVGRDLGGPYQQCVMQDQCSEQCGARTNFECVGKYTWPTTNDTVVPFRFRFSEAFTQEVVTDMEVKVCRADDLYCESPIDVQHTDASGEVALGLRTSFRTFQGYLELNKQTGDANKSIYPSLVRLGWPISEEGVTNVNVINEASVALNVAISMVDPDPMRGLLQVRFQSCSGLAAPGVSFTTNPTDAASAYWYAGPDGIPNFKETKSYNIGAGGVINAIEGRHIITATRASDGIKLSETAAPVRKGYMTIVLISPMGTN